ncbi:MAG: cyclic nucleotide-binding domain-containing protein [Azospirillaceae bacterium]|nr:cyclic nucleotide-binding domain-containing protein [Azospirillaceae bacterium]
MHDPIGLKAEDTETIRGTVLFQRLGDRGLRALLAQATVRTLDRGATLFLQGEPADRFFVLLRGWVKLYRLGRDGSEAVVALVGPGETFAEAAVFAHGGFPVCAQAIDSIRILTMTAASFARTIREDEEIAFAMLAAMSMRLRHLVSQVEQLQVRPAPQRLASFLLQFCAATTGSASFALPFDKALAAKRLGMQPETFSRALGKLRPLGVSVDGPTFLIADVERLRDFCSEDAQT